MNTPQPSLHLPSSGHPPRPPCFTTPFHDFLYSPGKSCVAIRTMCPLYPVLELRTVTEPWALGPISVITLAVRIVLRSTEPQPSPPPWELCRRLDPEDSWVTEQEAEDGQWTARFAGGSSRTRTSPPRQERQPDLRLGRAGHGEQVWAWAGAEVGVSRPQRGKYPVDGGVNRGVCHVGAWGERARAKDSRKRGVKRRQGHKD